MDDEDDSGNTIIRRPEEDRTSGIERPHPVYRLAQLSIKEIEDSLRSTGSSDQGIGLMREKFFHMILKVPSLDAREALILKQHMLSIGGEAGVGENVLRGMGNAGEDVLKDLKTVNEDVLRDMENVGEDVLKDLKTVNEDVLRDMENVGDVMLAGTGKQYLKLADKLREQPIGLSSVGLGIERVMGNQMEMKRSIFRARGMKMEFPPTRVMGIINVTPDSFSDGSKFFEWETAVKEGIKMAEEGADMIDVGGESTRPFSAPLTVKEELRRVIPVIEELSKKVECLISVDTYKSEVAQNALEAGAHIVNDVYAMRHSDDMGEVVKQYGAGIVLMHMKGSPSDMQVEPFYEDVIKEVHHFLKDRANTAREAGISGDRIMVDPGIGFGKRLCDNLEIIRNTSAFSSLGYPVLLGPSRKRFIGDITGRPVTERLNGTVAIAALATFAGADVLRVHDVGEVISGVKMSEAVMNHMDYR